MKKRKYIKPLCQLIVVDIESNPLMAATNWDPTVTPGTTIQESGQFEFIHEGSAGDEADSKFHHNWDAWEE